MSIDLKETLRTFLIEMDDAENTIADFIETIGEQGRPEDLKENTLEFLIAVHGYLARISNVLTSIRNDEEIDQTDREVLRIHAVNSAYLVERID